MELPWGVCPLTHACVLGAVAPGLYVSVSCYRGVFQSFLC